MSFKYKPRAPETEASDSDDTLATKGYVDSISPSVDDPGNVLGGNAEESSGVSVHPEADSSGAGSIAMGRDAETGNSGTGSGDGHIAIGDSATTKVSSTWNQDGIIAIGRNAFAGPYSVGIGSDIAHNGWSVLMGHKAGGSSDYITDSVIIGTSAQDGSPIDPYAYGLTIVGSYSGASGANSNETTIVGAYAWGTGSNGVGVGVATEPGEKATSLGFSSKSPGELSVAVGHRAYSEGEQSICIGSGEEVWKVGPNVLKYPEATGDYSIAIGSGDDQEFGPMGAKATADYSIALGTNVESDEANTAILGVPDSATGTYNWKIPGNLDIGNNFEILGNGNGVIMSSPNGTRYKLTIANDGSLTTTEVT